MSDTLQEDILRLKHERSAVILAHNYQPGEVQDIADFTGDSLELAHKATDIQADIIVFCGVHFMAETAAILNPDKTVLLPAADAGCPMANMIDGEQLRALKAQHPDAKVLCYVNSTAEVKAESDCCVTSANSVRVVNNYAPDQPIIFVPDRHLGTNTAGQLRREFILWPGCCPIHAHLTESMIRDARARHPGALVLIHPECPKPACDAADAVLSTGGMCRYVQTRSETEFIIGTETGILHRLRKENPEKTFYPLLEQAICPDMKRITLEKILRSLRDMSTVITVPEPTASKARRAIETMLAAH